MESPETKSQIIPLLLWIISVRHFVPAMGQNWLRQNLWSSIKAVVWAMRIYECIYQCMHEINLGSGSVNFHQILKRDYDLEKEIQSPWWKDISKYLNLILKIHLNDYFFSSYHIWLMHVNTHVCVANISYFDENKIYGWSFNYIALFQSKWRTSAYFRIYQNNNTRTWSNIHYRTKVSFFSNMNSLNNWLCSLLHLACGLTGLIVLSDLLCSGSIEQYNWLFPLLHWLEPLAILVPERKP